MTKKRMFSMNVIDSDAFMDLPLSAQALYLHLAMRADDDGFVNSPKKIQRMIGAADGDARALVQEKFIIPFESGIVCVKHWLMHNTIRKDRYVATAYTEEKGMLTTNENKSYSLYATRLEEPVATNGKPLVNQVATNGKPSIVEYSIDKSSSSIIDNISLMKEEPSETDATALVFKTWEDCGMQLNGLIRKEFADLIEIYSAEWVLEAIRRANRQNKKSVSYISGILESWKSKGGIDETGAEGRKQSEAAAAAKKKKDAEAERQKRLDELYESYSEADDGTDSGGADTALKKLKGDLA